MAVDIGDDRGGCHRAEAIKRLKFRHKPFLRKKSVSPDNYLLFELNLTKR